VLALAKGQHGHLARRQLLAMGLSRGAIDGRIESGEYVRVHHGVYCIAPRRDDPISRAAAAVLACGPEAVLSHGSAATLWGFLRYWTFPLEVIATQRKRADIATHRCRSLKRRDVTRQHGVPTTSPERTILDNAPRLTKRQLTRMVNDGRLSGYVHLAALTDVVARNPLHPGAKLLRPLVEQPGNPTRSGFEDDFKRFAATYGLPTPLINTTVNGWEVDAYFPDHRLIVELDGRRYHDDAQSFEEDRERDAEQLKRGVKTVRITDERFITSPDREAARLLEILDGQ
jgi:Transcriptional regulator, AbiEi antitoxin